MSALCYIITYLFQSSLHFILFYFIFTLHILPKFFSFFLLVLIYLAGFFRICKTFFKNYFKYFQTFYMTMLGALKDSPAGLTSPEEDGIQDAFSCNFFSLISWHFWSPWSSPSADFECLLEDVSSRNRSE